MFQVTNTGVMCLLRWWSLDVNFQFQIHWSDLSQMIDMENKLPRGSDAGDPWTTDFLLYGCP